MRTQPKELYFEADWYLLVGDATAIPVLGAILETLPKEAKGICIIEVHGKKDEQLLATQAYVAFTWLHNPHPENSRELASTVKSLVILADKRKFGYVAAEFSSVKGIRFYLCKEKLWQQKELYAFSYWKAGVSEDKSCADRYKEKEEH